MLLYGVRGMRVSLRYYTSRPSGIFWFLVAGKGDSRIPFLSYTLLGTGCDTKSVWRPPRPILKLKMSQKLVTDQGHASLLFDWEPKMICRFFCCRRRKRRIEYGLAF